MRAPTALQPLLEMGIVEEVLRPLMSGKEAEVYIVMAGGQERVAKVYKDATMRSFQKRTDYTDGRNVRNSRDRRAMTKRSRHGRSEDEASWRSTEVDVIYRLRDAGVRVPAPFNFMEGVLVMDLILDEDELPAPRLGDLTFSPEVAREIYDQLIQEVVRMLCAGVVHGDLSDFNVLMGAEGPVVIDFPQAVDPASSSTARKLLIRDVDNLHRFLSRSVPHGNAPYAQEMWDLFERNELTPDTRLRGQYRDKRGKADTKGVLKLVGDAQRDAQRRSEASRPAASKGRRGRKEQRRDKRGSEPQVEVLVRSGDGRTRLLHAAAPATKTPEPANPAKKRRRSRGRNAGNGPAKDTTPQAAADAAVEAPVKRRRRRRRRSPRGAGSSADTGEQSPGKS